MLIELLAVGSGGAIGAVTRYLTVVYAQLFLGSNFPHGTLLVNSIGSFLAGLLMILLVEHITSTSDYWRLFLMVGFLGGYTTFSSFSWETWVLYQSGKLIAAFFNILFNNILALTMAFLGIQLGRMLGKLI